MLDLFRSGSGSLIAMRVYVCLPMRARLLFKFNYLLLIIHVGPSCGYPRDQGKETAIFNGCINDDRGG